MYGITISFFVLAFLAAVLGELTDHWSQQDLNRVLKNAKSIVRSKDSSNQDVFYSLSLLNDSKDLKDSCDCKSLSDRIQSASAETYFAVQSAQICGCDYAADEKLSASTSDRLSVSWTKFHTFLLIVCIKSSFLCAYPVFFFLLPFSLLIYLN